MCLRQLFLALFRHCRLRCSPWPAGRGPEADDDREVLGGLLMAACLHEASRTVHVEAALQWQVVGVHGDERTPGHGPGYNRGVCGCCGCGDGGPLNFSVQGLDAARHQGPLLVQQNVAPHCCRWGPKSAKLLDGLRVVLHGRLSIAKPEHRVRGLLRCCRCAVEVILESLAALFIRANFEGLQGPDSRDWQCDLRFALRVCGAGESDINGTLVFIGAINCGPPPALRHLDAHWIPRCQEGSALVGRFVWPDPLLPSLLDFRTACCTCCLLFLRQGN
mmetsp:Transcript_148865/g.414780  ORF Transcript_148865/g.414780 Transcript_148865/m.414780 type:complete len:276 (-) Transcript_148865:76-903(-)